MSNKIVKISNVNGQTAQGFPGCQVVRHIFVENSQDEYLGAFVVGIRNGQICVSNGLTDSGVEISYAKIREALLEGRVEPTNSNGWWLY